MFLVPVKALSRIFRASFREELKKSELFAQVEQRVWRQDWVVHSEPVGSGAQAFQYLAPYIFRVAISNNRLRKLEQGNVTFSYKESATAQLKRCTVTAQEFIRRFLQHVLPNRFIKVRYYGLLSPAHRQLLHQARQLLSVTTSKLKREVVKTTEPVALLSLSALRRATHPALATRSQMSCPMKLPLLAMAVFLLSPTTAANCFRRHCRTLSASPKKPASLAGFLFLKLNLCRLPSLSLPLATPSHPPHISSLITQTPSSL